MWDGHHGKRVWGTSSDPAANPECLAALKRFSGEPRVQSEVYILHAIFAR